ncbi:hypothetical protein HYDPIDRAFT_175689 [Hydnomerulius pinastri MD-312]|uniref:Protein-S-isoprenylcysteine O-methyltransferase n=1 Tax=Hydnomerulius pinastri MD-312 TaxID=994086 RepID=A0A0C9VFP1_9AGAM|nr:hypothetical protein HYDPIDRAFT_175689 [Hydnomerulius pinastri MD-312]
MAFGKIVLLIAIMIGQHYSATAPNARPPSEELRKQTGWELVFPNLARVLKVIPWVWTLAEVAVLFAASDYCPPGVSQSIVDHLVRNENPTQALAQVGLVTRSFLAGSLSSISGSLIRIYCYRTLGRMFTFELSIRKEHKLITSGMYSVVRHPSYTGGIGVILGFLLCHFNPNSWLVSCSGLFPSSESKLAKALVYSWVSIAAVTTLGMRKRMNEEDAMLEKNFGEEWKDWVRRVPCRLFPWVY